MKRLLYLIPVLAGLFLAPGAHAQSGNGTDSHTRDFELKLNTLSLPLLVSNIGIELQALDHFSVSVPVYYSALNWFSENVKFRVLATQPELRFWLRKDLTGLFVNAHATVGWYNVAVGGDYRYQSYARKSPACGGGLGVGYKVRLGASRWGLEFGLGAGVLPLHYDFYYNIHNGRRVGDNEYTYWGPDQAFLSLTYRIGQVTHSRK